MKSYEYSPDRKRALSTVDSSTNLIWQKFFLLLRMAVISPHCPNTSMMSCSVAFSGRPPTNTVLQPGGRSLVAGGGRSVQMQHNNRQNLCIVCLNITRLRQDGNLETARILLLLIFTKSLRMVSWIRSTPTNHIKNKAIKGRFPEPKKRL